MLVPYLAHVNLIGITGMDPYAEGFVKKLFGGRAVYPVT